MLAAKIQDHYQSYFRKNVKNLVQRKCDPKSFGLKKTLLKKSFGPKEKVWSGGKICQKIWSKQNLVKKNYLT